MNEEDPRLCLLEKEWFQGKLCLDIGCNTGQVNKGHVTIAVKSTSQSSIA